jgi:hypothetical protein
MSKASGFYFAILIRVDVLLPSMVTADNLSVTVVDDSKHGVSSVIYQGVAADVIIGTTKNDGTLVVPSYKCNYDKPLQAKPIDAAHFNSDKEPCKTPLSFLVHSRMTPSGSIAFNRIWADVKFPDGSDGQINFKIAMDIDKHSAQLSGGPRGLGGCKLDYYIKGYGNVSQMGADGWKNVSQSEEPATDIFSFDQKNVDQLSQHGAFRAEKNDKGITVFVPGDCEHAGVITDEFANMIEEEIDQKVKARQYKSPKDLIRFNESK